MQTAIIKRGENLLVIHRRRFDKDIRRHFVGTVEAYEDGIVRASGYVFVNDDLNKHVFLKRPDRRIKLIPVASGDVIVNVIPNTVDIDQVQYEVADRTLWITDGDGWKMDIKEFGWG